MVMDRPTRGALGGVSAGVGAVAQTAADRLAAGRDLRASVWLERAGRLRCAASTGDWPGRDGISPTSGVVGATFTSGVETVVPDAAARDPRARAEGVVAEACVPLRSGGCVVGVIHVRVMRPLRAGDLEHIRAAAEDLGRRIDALGGPAAESAAQRVLRHMTNLSALDEPDAIASALLAAALDVVALDSAVLVRRGGSGAVAVSGAIGVSGAAGVDDAAEVSGAAGAGGAPGATTIGPLGDSLAHAPATTISAIEHAAHDGAGVVVATPADLKRPELAPLGAAGVRTLIAVGLVAHGERHGLLLLAGRTERAVAIDDLELLELLAAHAATCLRTADLMRTLRAQAATDPLTGLGHHATFHATLAHAHRRPTTAVVLVDLDGFKRLNDTFGHQHGDHVLRGVAAALSGALRRGDTLFRIGGDEFAALLVVSDQNEALEAGVRLREAVRDADLGVTVSIGVAVPIDGEPDVALLARADRALYRAKDAGRDGVALAGDERLPVTPPV
jgi:diguanylate cyclase (GGDEF)-like protein